MKNHLRIISFCLLLPFLFFSKLYAQTNPGFKANGGPAIVKSVADIIAEEIRIRAVVKRTKLEKKNPSNRVQNPLAPAVSSSNSADGSAFRTGSATAVTNMRIHSNFLASYYSEGAGYYPPDCNGDVSTASQVLIVVNGRLKVFNVPRINATAATTTDASSTSPMSSPVLNLDLDAFFGNAGLGISAVCDPHVRFDRLSNKWFVIAQDKSHTASNYICIAVSNSSTLTSTSTFSIYYMLGNTNSDLPAEDYFDYPTLGTDKHALYIGGSIYNKTTGVNKGAVLFLVNKASLIAGSLSFTVWQYGLGAGKSGSDGAVGVLIPQGVHNDDPNATEGYFIGVDFAAYSKLVMKRITDPGGSPSLSADLPITVATTSAPVNQQALGSASTIDAFDDRLFAAMAMKNKLTGATTIWTAHNIGVNASGVATTTSPRNGSRWYEIKDLTTTPVVKQFGTLYDNAATYPKGFWMPSIAMNGQGHAVMGTSTASYYRRVQAAFTSRYSSDAAGTLQTYDTVTKANSAYSPSAGTPYRWGDYSQTVVDPVDNMTFWTFQEYTTSTNLWGLRAVQIKAPAPAASISFSGTPSTYCGSNVPVTITGSGTSGEGFFDPGEEVNGPGYNRLTVSCSGGISVSNITYVSATQVTCNINTLGKTSGSYTITVTNPDGQFVTGNFTLSACDPLTWDGSQTTAWGTANNWTPSRVPTANDYVTIPSSVPNMPLLTAISPVYNLTVQTGATLTVTGTLQVAANIANSGTITATNGTIELNGTSPQTIAANSFAGNTIANLKISNSSVTSAGALNITGTLSFGNINNATFNTSNLLTLKSTASGTAIVADVTNNGVNSNNTISGEVTVERYISGSSNRAYRMVSSPINTTVSSTKPYLRDNWQEGVNNPNSGSNSNPNAGYGTHITGSSSGSNGFDATTSGEPSLYAYNQASDSWIPASGTNSILMDAKAGYLLYVRGDRSVNLNATGAPLPSSNTTLRSHGNLVTGTTTFSGLASNGAVSMITNPFASAIKWNTIYSNNSANFENYYTYWDPNIATAGGYVTVTNIGVVSPATSASVNIQTGQAVFVQTKAGIISPSITIREIDKSTVNNADIFGTTTVPDRFSISLYFTRPVIGRRLADGVKAIYADGYSAGLDGNDADEIRNWEENISLSRGTRNLSIEARPPVTSTDTLFLSMHNMNQESYQFEFNASGISPAVMAQLVDKFTGSRKMINVTTTTIIPFTVTADPASKAEDRFYIVFMQAAPLPVSLHNFKAWQKNAGVQLEWETSQEIQMKNYEVERSSNGQLYKMINSVAATANNNSAASYTLFDGNPINGTNFYRIKSVSKNNVSTYSQVLKLSLGKEKGSALTVYPNPVTGNNISIQMNIPQGSYTISLVNKLGQEVYTTQFEHKGGSFSESFTIPNALAAGIYNLKVKGETLNLVEKIIKN